MSGTKVAEELAAEQGEDAKGGVTDLRAEIQELLDAAREWSRSEDDPALLRKYLAVLSAWGID